MDYSSSGNDLGGSDEIAALSSKAHNDKGGLPRHFVPRNDRNKSQNKNERILSGEEALEWIRKIRQKCGNY